MCAEVPHVRREETDASVPLVMVGEYIACTGEVLRKSQENLKKISRKPRTVSLDCRELRDVSRNLCELNKATGLEPRLLRTALMCDADA